jgi:hypothetical protein
MLFFERLCPATTMREHLSPRKILNGCYQALESWWQADKIIGTCRFFSRL